ncbi:MAG: hypothetical protein CSA55_00820 [Ilumatobacter coccineus]|uniref:Uncharacterized protein n=1 Tax=Ilumatobacter coccineus TaxID=467094 RepID=A0A2G6KFM9_9ACTN|nr:MAG: hypothetical protein CSA55_00820 [Ilumatobacter coccineus]
MAIDVSDDELDLLIHRVDLDGLIRLIDARTTIRDWEGLIRVRQRCRTAARETGRQLWPAATLAEYRIALWSPARWAAGMIDDEPGRFTVGPLTEVIASRHTWAELAPHLDPTPAATFVAHERAIRGEPIPDADLAALPPVLDIPAQLQAWEPTYPISTYDDVSGTHPEPIALPDLDEIAIDSCPVIVDDPATELALRHVVETWTSASTGRAEVSCVEGPVTDALAALGVRRARLGSISAAEAIARLAWAGASGGAHGRRQGMAIGRFSAWWVLGALGDLHDDWPPTLDDLSALLDELEWWVWDAGEPAGGWRLQIGIHHRGEGLSWALNASDHA